MTKKSKKIYICESCGNEFYTWSGRCEGCGEWNTLKEFSPRMGSSFSGDMEFKKLSEVLISSEGNRIKTGIFELDRVLGGGIVEGSVILLGGEPGIGKSTLTLQVCGNLTGAMYVSAEESATQIKMRARRLKIKAEEIDLFCGGDISGLDASVEKIKPTVLIIDSIQTVFLSDIAGTPGSMIQVRECGMYLQRIAKKTGIPIIIIGHVTKEGNLAGPKMLEHLVDAVLYFEGERYLEGRIVRGIKNRFGSTDEIGIFEMKETGLVEVTNPSEMFLDDREDKPGSVIAVVMEGSRPILVEIQALTVSTNFGYPKRTSSGFDLNRLNLLSAVISKHTNMNLNNFDIYLNVVGGLKIKEPATDAAVCASIMSSYKNLKTKEKFCVIGEVGLLGEIRRVGSLEKRIKEAEKRGFVVIKECKNLLDLAKKLF